MGARLGTPSSAARAVHGRAPVPPPLARLLADTVQATRTSSTASTEAEPIAGIEARAMLSAWCGTPRGSRPMGSASDHRCRRFVSGSSGDGRCDRARRRVGRLGGLGSAVGEVVVSGDHVLRGYLNDPESERRTKIHDGATVWHRTGDGARSTRKAGSGSWGA